MSYVRWSTPVKLPDGVDAFGYLMDREEYPEVATSDLYVYEHVDGFIAIHVAGNRHKPAKRFDGPTVVDVNPETGFGRPNPEWLDWLDQYREVIDHPDAGATFDIEDPAEAIAKVEYLIGEGFLAPDWLVKDMREDLLAQREQET